MKANSISFRSIVCIILILLLFSCNRSEVHVNTCNPSSSKEALNLLKYLYSLSGEKTLAGQHNYIGRMSEASDQIALITQRYPALWGSDFGFSDSSNDIDNIIYRPDLIKEIEKQNKRGCIITLTYHQGNPVIGEPCPFKGGVQSKLTDQQWKDILTPGTEVYELWKKQMDTLAVYLKILAEKKIPVIFRPYHEMNGDWFWWGGKPGDDGFSGLWKQTFNYLTYQNKINNLIWAWCPDKPYYGLTEYYPGNEYVDVIGCDIYPEKDTNIVYRKEWYDEILVLAGDKPVAISECSIFPDAKILAEQPRWIWFMGWDKLSFINEKENIQKLYKNPDVLSIEKEKDE